MYIYGPGRTRVNAENLDIYSTMDAKGLYTLIILQLTHTALKYFLYKQRNKAFIQFLVIIILSVSSFCFICIPLLLVYDI